MIYVPPHKNMKKKVEEIQNYVKEKGIDISEYLLKQDGYVNFF